MEFDVDLYEKALKEKIDEMQDLICLANLPDTTRHMFEIKLLAFEEARDLLRQMRCQKEEPD